MIICFGSYRNIIQVRWNQLSSFSSDWFPTCFAYQYSVKAVPLLQNCFFSLLSPGVQNSFYSEGSKQDRKSISELYILSTGFTYHCSRNILTNIEKTHSATHPPVLLSPCILFLALKADLAFRNNPRPPQNKFQVHYITQNIYCPIVENMAFLLRHYL